MRPCGSGYFEREESIGHLRRRKPGITDAEADEVAEVLGDMPLAVAAAGALLATQKMSVPEYLGRLRAEPISALPEDHLLHDYPVAVAKAWNLSLDHCRKVRRGRPAAADMLGDGAGDQPRSDQRPGDGGHAAGI